MRSFKKGRKIINQALYTLQERRGKLWPLFIPLLIYVPGIAGKIPFPSTESRFTDLLISHYPNALYLRTSLANFRAAPLWSPLILSGYPFFANPLSGMWYPFGWLVLLFPLPAGLSIGVALHALWSGVGCYKLLRNEGVQHGPALIGALAFEALPKISAHYGAGHITLIYAVYWTPWLLLAARGEKGVPHSALVMAAIFLADPRWSVYSGLLWLAYYIAHSQKGRWLQLVVVFKVVVYAFLIAAPLAVPMLEYVPRTTRWGMTVDEILTQSLSPVEIIGGLFPAGGRSPETAFYVGGFILVLSLIGLIQPDIRKNTRLWGGAALLSGIFALGSNIPGMTLAARLPGFSLLRVPPRALFILSLSVIAIAVHTVNKLVHTRLKRTYLLPLIAASLFFILLLVGIGYSVNAYHAELVWGISAITLGLVMILVYANIPGISSTQFLNVLTILVLVDTLGAAYFNIDYRSSNLNEPAEKVQWLIDKINQPGKFRTYSPSYSLPQEQGARYQFEMVDGVDPLQLESYVRFMETATGIPQQGYSVTVPPYNGSPGRSNQGAVLDPSRLGMLNVKFIISEFQISAENLIPVVSAEQGFVYRNEQFLPRAWVQPWSEEKGFTFFFNHSDQLSTPEILRWDPNQIKLKAKGPGTLVLSEIAYPGWQVFVDGQRSKPGTHYNLLRGVSLDSGFHNIEFRYRPLSLTIGIMLFLAGISLTYREYQIEG